MGQIDVLTKNFMDDNNRFADAINCAFYDGKQVIKNDDLQELDTNELTVSKDKNKTKKNNRDVLKSAIIKKTNNCTYQIIFGIENQTNVDNTMPIRNMLYDALRYDKQIKHIKKNNLDSKDDKIKLTSEEFLSGFRKEDKLLPVVSLVVYFGCNKWDGPLSLCELLDIDKDDELLTYINDYKVTLLSPVSISDEKLNKLNSDLYSVFASLKYINDSKALTKLYEEDERLHNLNVETANLINELTSMGIEIPDDEEATVNMNDAFAKVRNEFRQEDEARGRVEGTLKTLLSLVKKGKLSLEDAVEETGLSEEEFKSKLNETDYAL